MLVLISDLHFTDGTAGKHNVPADAFRIFFRAVAGTAKRLKRAGGKIREIKIVFLGDIFDLLRTETWFEHPVSERPWGGDSEGIEKNAATILDGIIKENQDAFGLLGGDLKREFGLPSEPERIYVPGNHDRLCDRYQTLRDRVCDCLNIPRRGSLPFEHYFEDVDYGVFCRHGHEYDQFNYEGGLSYEYDEYMRVPIGDPITTELISRLPRVLKGKIESLPLTAEEKGRLVRNFRDIDNVRPFSAVLEWLLYQVKRNLSLKEMIEVSVDEVIGKFNNLDFVRAWYRHHDRWTDWCDEADKIQSVLWLYEHFRAFPSHRLLAHLMQIKRRLSERDDFLEAAYREYLHLDSRISYVVYGHTHEPRRVLLDVVENERGRKEHFYLNTGTWRVTHQKATKGPGFMSLKNMTWVAFYKKEERGTDFPSFETWTGSLKTAR
ncbi:MAG: hypothetical protein JRH07_06525 [Deltaproteobacteria bacterium]|nr:hypothetical protein [Deltaproteobacteria bacterium]